MFSNVIIPGSLKLRTLDFFFSSPPSNPCGSCADSSPAGRVQVSSHSRLQSARFVFVCFVFFILLEKRNLLLTPVFRAAAAATSVGCLGSQRTPAPSLLVCVFFYFCFVICFIFRRCLAGRGQRRRLVGADESRWRADPSSSSSAVNHTSGTDSPRLSNVEAARPSPLPTSVSYTQSPADFGLNIPPAALNTAGCLPL